MPPCLLSVKIIKREEDVNELRKNFDLVAKVDDFFWGPAMLVLLVGTGNIVGVATAMVSGGPGALVWMWISACFGLTSKFSECMLAIKYRERNEKGAFRYRQRPDGHSKPDLYASAERRNCPGYP